MRKISGIYKIEDKASGMVYVGLSTNLADRWRSHLLNFLCGQGINKYHPELKIENLSFSILELWSNDKLDEREKYWISYYDSYNKGFNRTEGGRRGYNHIKGAKRKKKKEEKQVIKPVIVKTKVEEKRQVPSIYYDWHPVSELRELIKVYPLYDSKGKQFLVWNQARKYYGDRIESRRHSRKQIQEYRFREEQE